MTTRLALLAGLCVVVAVAGCGEKPKASEAEETGWVEVKRVRSGDRVTVEPDDDLSYAGIRAPLPDEPLHDDAKRRNAELVEGKKVRVRFDVTRQDRKGRILGYVFVDGVQVNETLVREGLAYVRLTPDTHRYSETLLAAQAEARGAKRGLWGTRRPMPSGPFSGDRKYGNFHTSACEELTKKDPTRIVKLNRADEAYAQGFAPCSKCLSASASP